jgi:hypothetical protein
MPCHLLIGAGFSRNWGGWLAGEAFEFLLGCPEVIADPQLSALLWRHQATGGFEGALDELQTAFERDPQNTAGPLMALQAAVVRMFVDMNNAFMSITDWEFQSFRDRQVGAFLTRFDTIFSLNQDVLIEHYYIGRDTASLGGIRQWPGVQMPGLRKIRIPEGMNGDSWAKATWSPDDDQDFSLDALTQPFIKLHGSSNWERGDGSNLLIMGGAKAREIGRTPLLNRYAEIFEKALCTAGAKLMVIGYGFRDSHINEAIQRGVDRGLKLFVIAPEGADIARSLNQTRKAAIAVETPLEAMLARSLIGASRRGLRDIFGGDTAEHNKVMRFFG